MTTSVIVECTTNQLPTRNGKLSGKLDRLHKPEKDHEPPLVALLSPFASLCLRVCVCLLLIVLVVVVVVYVRLVLLRVNVGGSAEETQSEAEAHHGYGGATVTPMV